MKNQEEKSILKVSGGGGHRLQKSRLLRGILQATRESALRLENNMKVKKVAVAAAVCAALMGSQSSFAEERMDFAFGNAEVPSDEISELSGSEMDETVGSTLWSQLNFASMQPIGAVCFSFSNCWGTNTRPLN